MKEKSISIFQDFQKVLVICPKCGEIHRLGELKLTYRKRVRHTWLDKLRKEENKVKLDDERLKEEEDKIRKSAREEGRKQIPKLLKKCVPVIYSHGYNPQDLKTLFDPVDFVIFDGMNLKDRIKQVVFFDGPAYDERRETIQTSVKRVIEKGNYDWYTVRLDDMGHIIM